MSALCNCKINRVYNSFLTSFQNGNFANRAAGKSGNSKFPGLFLGKDIISNRYLYIICIWSQYCAYNLSIISGHEKKYKTYVVGPRVPIYSEISLFAQVVEKWKPTLGNECQIIKHFLDDFHTFALKGWGCVWKKYRATLLLQHLFCWS